MLQCWERRPHKTFQARGSSCESRIRGVLRQSLIDCSIRHMSEARELDCKATTTIDYPPREIQAMQAISSSPLKLQVPVVLGSATIVDELRHAPDLRSTRIGLSNNDHDCCPSIGATYFAGHGQLAVPAASSELQKL